jgi:hypothetical protein
LVPFFGVGFYSDHGSVTGAQRAAAGRRSVNNELSFTLDASRAMQRGPGWSVCPVSLAESIGCNKTRSETRPTDRDG